MNDEPPPKREHRNYKTRSNYAVLICLKEDCWHRGSGVCKKCIRFSHYRRKNK